MTTQGRDDPTPDDALPDDLADVAGQQLLAATGAERRRVLAALVAAHPRYTAELRRLCRDLECVDGVFAESYPATPPLDGAMPERLGGYRPIRRLGDGAFGIVWLCAQATPVARHVAVKVLRADVGGASTLQRFTAERQVLASLNHPAITQVFDAGELPDGRQFFVMEYVDGEPLGRYCDARSLSIRARLRVFVDVCRGTAHAHARGIVHRDLKPANVLVVDTDAGPAPKIIDFGIAKALFPAAAANGGTATEAGRVVGTPGYMSPEQAAGRVDEIDARSDVFALGVMLYELLTGELPWPRGAAATTADPPRPSVRVAAAADPRHHGLAAELRGELDWITTKALARERDDRYASAAALASDLERHLRGETVAAGPPSLTYRARKFVRRNTVAVVAVSLALVLAAIAWCGWTMQANDAAKRSAQALLAVQRLLDRASDERLRRAPQNDAIRQGLAQDALDFYELWLRDRPAERALRLGRCQALVQLSLVHWQLGQLEVAERTAAEAVAEARSLLDEATDDLSARAVLAEALRRNGRALATTSREAAAVPLLKDATAHFEACFAAAPPKHALPLSSALRELASSLRASGKGHACLAAERRSVAVLEQVAGTAAIAPQLHTDLAIARSTLVRDLVAAKLLPEAETVLRAASDGLPAVQQERDHVASAIENAWAQLFLARGDLPNAAARMNASIAAAARWRAAEPGRFQPSAVLLDALRDLAVILDEARQWPESDAAMLRTIDAADAMVREFPDDLERLNVVHRLLVTQANRLYDRLRRPDLALAERFARRAIEVHAELERRGWPQRAPRSQSFVLLATIVESQGGDTTELWERVANELTVDADLDAPDHELDFSGWLGVASNRLRRGQLDAIEVAVAQAARCLGDPPRHKSQATDFEWLKAGIARERRDAAALVAIAQRIIERRDTWMGRWRAADCRLFAAEILATADPAAARTHRDEASALYRRVVDELAPRVAEDPGDPWLAVPCGFAGARLATIEAGRGRTEDARRLLDTSLGTLEAVAEVAHRDLWQPEVFGAASTLRDTLAEDRR